MSYLEEHLMKAKVISVTEIESNRSGFIFSTIPHGARFARVDERGTVLRWLFSDPNATVKHYMSLDQACKAASKRSLFAHQRGEYSQYLVRVSAKHGFGIVAGPATDMQDAFKAYVQQIDYSAGYRV